MCSHLLQLCSHGSRLSNKKIASTSKPEQKSDQITNLPSILAHPVRDSSHPRRRLPYSLPSRDPSRSPWTGSGAAFFSSTASAREHASKINGKWEEACICPPLPLTASVVHPLGECVSKSMQASVLHPNYLLDTLLQKWHRKIYNGHTFTKNHIYPHKVTMYPYGFAYSNAWAYLSKAQVTCHNQLYDMLHILRMMSDEDKLQQN